MKLPIRLLALAACASFLALGNAIAHAQTASARAIAGVWQGTATICGGVSVPVTARISGPSDDLRFALLNGRVSHPDVSPASSAAFDGTHLTVSFDYYARKIVATVADGKLTGTFIKGALCDSGREDGPFVLTRVARAAEPSSAAKGPDIAGTWEIAAKSEKGENAWTLRVTPAGKSPLIQAVIQRIDGDTGSLWGTWNGTSFTVGHFAAANTMLYALTPQPDGTLLVKSLLGGAAAKEWTARRPDEARKQNLPGVTDPTQQTSIKDPSVPFAFSFPDLTGKTVSNTDQQFQGKVVIVTIGGSWCPNCHDEAPFLVELYKKYHARGLEIVELDFETQGDEATENARLRTFIARYGIPYPVLFAGPTEEVEQKIPQAVNLNSWPTSFFLGRDGRVREVHAGFASEANAAGHAELVRDVTALIEKLLAEPSPQQSSAVTP
jgi:thiol-disulfide isomerase/thioredoxin